MSQKRKNNKNPESTTCQMKPNPGPVNRIDTVAVQRITKARINRVLCFRTDFCFMKSQKVNPTSGFYTPPHYVGRKSLLRRRADVHFVHEPLKAINP